MLSTESETVSAPMATSSSFSPGALGSSVMGSFFDEYMPCVVTQQNSAGPLSCCTESDGDPRVYSEVCFALRMPAKSTLGALLKPLFGQFQSEVRRIHLLRTPVKTGKWRQGRLSEIHRRFLALSKDDAAGRSRRWDNGMNERVQRQADAAKSSSFTSARSGLLQRKCACGGTPGADGLCAECRRKRVTLQRRPFSPAERSEAPPIVHEVLRSPGEPLDAGTRAIMEPRFGHDFGRVRVHTDERAAESARAVDALAYTVGRDVVFEAGQYAPGSEAGRRL